MEPLFALLCAWLVSLAGMLLPLGLALAAGAMLLVVTQEVIPESRRNGHEKLASLGLLVGFLGVSRWPELVAWIFRRREPAQ